MSRPSVKIARLLICWAVLSSLAILVSRGSALASDGRIELNQASITDAGGFPFTIAAPGSYLLTGDLLVDDGTTGLQIAANQVSLDLNGFAIRSGHVCDPGSCAAGIGTGIEAVIVGSELAADTTVRNGTVAGFGDDCLALGARSRVEGLVIQDCGGSGVNAAEHAAVSDSRIGDCGGWGLQFLAAALYGENILTGVNRLGGTGFISGGTASEENICDAGPCTMLSPRPRLRRYYMTTSFHTGSTALDACADGYHMASLWEIWDPSQLEYDVALGKDEDDSGFGPPTGELGWVRTGSPSIIGGNQAGLDNCLAWTTDSGEGTVATLTNNWTDAMLQRISPWQAATVACSAILIEVWCVED